LEPLITVPYPYNPRDIPCYTPPANLPGKACYPITEMSTFVLGIGNVQITVSAEAPSEANATKTTEGVVLGIFVII